MTRFLFWNLNGPAAAAERNKGKVRPLLPTDPRYRRLRRALRILVARHDADVVILAESPFEGQADLPGFAEARTTLLPNRTTRTRLEVYHRGTVVFTGFETVSRAILHDMEVVASGRRILLVSAHLDSPLRLDERMRARKVVEFASDIRNREESLGHTDTVVVGDLNYDPQDAPIATIDGLNAVPSKAVARRLVSKDRRSEYPYFYNPMWAHLTDITGDLPGSYFRPPDSVYGRVWHLPDQVLIRPSLLPSWEDADLHVCSAAGKINLLDGGGRPDVMRFSDHLPIVFQLDL